MTNVYNGSCLCGAVRFILTKPIRPIIACHCQQCRKTSGHYWAATSVSNDRLNIKQSKGLVWYNSSDTARRGFCATCGSSLFWQPLDQNRTAVAAGVIDDLIDQKITAHVFCAYKGDYYNIDEDLPKFNKFSGDENA